MKKDLDYVNDYQLESVCNKNCVEYGVCSIAAQTVMFLLPSISVSGHMAYITLQKSFNIPKIQK